MTVPHVVRRIRRPDPDVVEALGAFGASTVHEAQGRTGAMDGTIRPILPGTHIAGPAVTVRLTPGDNLMLHVALEWCQPGDVLVATTETRSAMGYFGGLLATLAKARGVRGLVIDGGCRDIAELRELPFPAWSRYVAMSGTVKASLGGVNQPVVCAGQYVEPGDVVVADDDGVVVVPRRQAEAIRDAAEARERKEESARARYAQGELSLDVHAMRGLLDGLGIVYGDGDT